MRRRRLGRSGLTVGEVGLGTMTWGTRTPAEEALATGRAFLAAGGDLVDTAAGYADGASEELVGRLLAERDRSEVVVCTKAGISRTSGSRVVDTSRRGLTAQLRGSLARLGTDHVDLWLVHAWSDEVPLEETLATLRWAQEAGHARYVGVSNYSGWQLARAVSLAERDGLRLVADEVEWSLVERTPEHEVVPAAAALGVGILAWSPIGRGVLTGKYRHGTPPDSRGASPELAAGVGARLGDGPTRVVEALVTAARGLESSPSALALAWLLSHPGVSSAVAGPRTEAQLRGLLHGLDTELPAEIRRALDEVSAQSL